MGSIIKIISKSILRFIISQPSTSPTQASHFKCCWEKLMMVTSASDQESKRFKCIQSSVGERCQIWVYCKCYWVWTLVSRKWGLSAVIRPQPTGTVLTGADITDLGYNLNNRTHQHPAWPQTITLDYCRSSSLLSSNILKTQQNRLKLKE